MTHYLIVPGYGGSGPEHWQTYFEQQGPAFQRVEQTNWNQPDLESWADRLEEALSSMNRKQVVLVGHSLGCHTVAQWSFKYKKPVKAALLVAPPDPVRARTQIESLKNHRFSPHRLPFHSLLVASSNDPWASISQAQKLAFTWGSRFLNIGNAGHINAQSGHYVWKEGLDLLYSLR